MNEANKENSSLELYEIAYKLHYSDGNIPEACRIYKALIDEFPNSNECGYAVIQLQKILANDVSDRVKTGRKTTVTSILLVFCVLLCTAVFFFSFASLKKADSKVEALSLVSQALSIMYGGNDNEALELLNKAKTLSGGTLIDPYLLSATIYVNMQRFSQARGEYEAYQKLSGKTNVVFKKLVTIRVEREKAEKTSAEKADSLVQTQPSPAATSASEGTPPTATFKPEKMTPPPSKLRPKVEKMRPTARPIKRASPSNPDSISFF
jgi:tetratricopeptide (TPR) repeat protein